MISDLEIFRTAHLMMHEYGEDAEGAAAAYAELMLDCGDRDGLLTWSRVRRTIAAMERMPAGLAH